MSSAPMLRCGAALVVFDGPHRLIWQRISAARWTPSRLWPSSTEAAEVTESLSRGDPLLIILDRRPEPVPVLVDELAGAPRAVTDLVYSVASGVAELRIPRLTWLPGQLVRRGERFVRDATETLAQSPALLLPPLILEPCVESPDNLWFAMRARSDHWSATELTAVINHVIAGRCRVAVNAVS